MGKHIQIRNVDEDVHRSLKIRAAQDGVTLSEFVKRLLETELAKPSWESVRARLEAMPPLHLSESPTDAVRAERDSR
ncbi:MAG: hypothetical protein WBF53_10545 [Litorimonas sp.]